MMLDSVVYNLNDQILFCKLHYIVKYLMNAPKTEFRLFVTLICCVSLQSLMMFCCGNRRTRYSILATNDYCF